MWISTQQVNSDRTVCVGQILEKKREYNEAVYQLFVDFKKAYDSVRKEVLYNILTQFGIPKKLVRLIKFCLSETYSRVRVDKNLSDMLIFGNVLKQVYVLSHSFLQLSFSIHHYASSGKPGGGGVKLNGTVIMWFVVVTLIYWVTPYIL
jgi:hypothetical protein